MRKRKSEVVRHMLENGRRLYAHGWVSDEDMRQLEWIGMPPPAPLTPKEVRAIREREDLNLYVFANMLNTTARALHRWEQGLNRPTGPALRLLHAIRDKGMATVFPSPG